MEASEGSVLVAVYELAIQGAMMPDPIRVTPNGLRAHADCVGEVPYHREMVLRAADRIEALEAALGDAAALLPPERWGLLQPSTREALDA